MRNKLLFSSVLLAASVSLSAQKSATITLHADQGTQVIPKEIYGQFAEHLGTCIYGGLWVGENSDIPNIKGYRTDVFNALKELQVPVLRWPGGCFADEYHWMDGIGPKENRPKMVNNNWGGTIEDNSFGTHEFLNLCEMLGTEPYISGNVGSGTVEELAKWVEYMTSEGDSPMARLRRQNGRDKAWKVKYLGVGNESWGCGGSMRPEYYSDLYRRYATYCRNYSGNDLYKIASGANADDYNWTDVLMKQVTPWNMKGMSLHYYTVPTGDWGHKGSATDFDGQEYYKTIRSTLKMEELVTRHSAIMERYDPEHRVGLIVDEWGTWYDVEPGTNPGFLYQQNTMRDAVVAGINLNIFNAHSDRIPMANIAQAVNVLQAILLTEGAKTVKTPTYHVFDLYKNHQDADLIYSHVENEFAEEGVPALSQSASVKDGAVTVTISNASLTEEYSVDIAAAFSGIKSAQGRVLAGEVHEHNTFDEPDRVTIKPLTVSAADGRAAAVIPPCSVAEITLTL